MPKKEWSASRTDWKDPNAPASGIDKTAKDVEQATRDVNVEGRKGAILSSSGRVDPADVAADGQALESKLGALKDQLAELRSAIKSFETEFDERLDKCLQQIVTQKTALESQSP